MQAVETPGLYRVFYATPEGEGFYSISAMGVRDALEEGCRLARAGYGSAATILGARLLRVAWWANDNSGREE